MPSGHPVGLTTSGRQFDSRQTIPTNQSATSVPNRSKCLWTRFTISDGQPVARGAGAGVLGLGAVVVVGGRVVVVGGRVEVVVDEVELVVVVLLGAGDEPAVVVQAVRAMARMGTSR